MRSETLMAFLRFWLPPVAGAVRRQSAAKFGNLGWRLLSSAPLRLEELLEQLRRLVCEQPPFHDRPVVEPLVARDVAESAAVAGLRIGAAEDDPADAGVHGGPGAHRARLD